MEIKFRFLLIGLQRASECGKSVLAFPVRWTSGPNGHWPHRIVRAGRLSICGWQSGAIQIAANVC
jgi:hypothetical protein